MNRVALVTGAAGALGRAVVAKFVEGGWCLVVVGRDAARLREAFGSEHLQIEADCSTVAGVRRIFDAVADRQLLPTALAHCVGNIRLGSVHRMSEADFDDCLRANLVSAFHTLGGFIGALREARSPGAAVLVSSAAAQVGTSNHDAVSAAKAGVEGLIRGAAATHAAAGIRVNGVAPGVMDTPAASAILASPAAREAAARQYPLGGIGSPVEMARLIGWLLSEHAARVTGQVWAMDAGFTRIRPLVK